MFMRDPFGLFPEFPELFTDVKEEQDIEAEQEQAVNTYLNASDDSHHSSDGSSDGEGHATREDRRAVLRRSGSIPSQTPMPAAGEEKEHRWQHDLDASETHSPTTVISPASVLHPPARECVYPSRRGKRATGVAADAPWNDTEEQSAKRSKQEDDLRRTQAYWKQKRHEHREKKTHASSSKGSSSKDKATSSGRRGSEPQLDTKLDLETHASIEKESSRREKVDPRKLSIESDAEPDAMSYPTCAMSFPTYVPTCLSMTKVIAAAANEPTCFMNIRPGTSLADTAAQRGVIGTKAFRALEKLLFQEFGLRPRLLSFTLPAAGIGGTGQALGTVEWPLGLPGNNGLIQMTVLDNERVPPLTPVGLFTELKTVIDLGSRKLTYGNKQSQELETLPSGHIAHSIVDFTKAWTHPDAETDKRFRYKKGEEFSPLSLRANGNSTPQTFVTDTPARLETRVVNEHSHARSLSPAASSDQHERMASHRHSGDVADRVRDRDESSQASTAQSYPRTREGARSRNCLSLATLLSQAGKALSSNRVVDHT